MIRHTSPFDIDLSSHGSAPTFTVKAFQRDVCNCPEILYLCHPCGQTLSNADILYKRLWTWKAHYSNIGGLGTGIGEGNKVIECGRGKRCLASKEVKQELEIDYNSNSVSDPIGTALFSKPAENFWSVGDAASIERAGYWGQEIEGIGGLVKTKVGKIVKVGQTVMDYEDEKGTAQYLGRERRGLVRSWCGWCSRVILQSTYS